MREEQGKDFFKFISKKNEVKSLFDLPGREPNAWEAG